MQASPKISSRTKEHLCTATYRYKRKENLSLEWKWGVLDITRSSSMQDLIAESN